MKKEIIAIFKPDGILLEEQNAEDRECYFSMSLLLDFNKNPYRTLLHFGFEEKNSLMSQGLAFLHKIAEFFVEKQTKNSYIEVSSEPPQRHQKPIRSIIPKNKTI